MTTLGWTLDDGCRESACLARQIDHQLTWTEGLSESARKALADAANLVEKAHHLLHKAKES